MLGWAVTFLAIAVIAGLFWLVSVAVGIAKVLFFVFIGLFVIAMIVRAMQGRPPV